MRILIITALLAVTGCDSDLSENQRYETADIAKEMAENTPSNENRDRINDIERRLTELEESERWRSF